MVGKNDDLFFACKRAKSVAFLIFHVRGYQGMIIIHFLPKFPNFFLSMRENSPFLTFLRILDQFLTKFWPKTRDALIFKPQKPSVSAKWT